MKRLFVAPAILLMAAFALSGCASSNSSRAPDGTNIEQSFSLKEIKISIPSLLVVQRSKHPFYIVLDPAKVQDAYYLKFVSNWGKMMSVELKDFQEFVRRDLVKVLQDQFETVVVVEPGFTPPESTAWIADVKIDDVENKFSPMGNIFEMRWSFAVRAIEQNEYLASYAFKSTNQGKGGVIQLLESAVSDVMRALTEKNSNDISILQILTKASASDEPMKTAEERAIEESI